MISFFHRYLDPAESLAEVGGLSLWRVAMKPGRPQAFGAAGGRICVGA